MMVKATQKVIRRAPFMVMVFCAFVLSACSNTSESWQHSTKPKDLWSKDIAACKSRASALINRQLDIDSDSSFRNRDELQTQFAVYDARKKRYSYFTNCLSGKGYRRISSN
jgi:predicted small secreted protein|tara:strand:+ start:4800 stop:5132 length:333 start_codon:yes stop_codon:yes gene_type:complete